MIRRLWPLLAAALLCATAVQAQVAAPELVPAAPRLPFPNLLGFNSGTVTPDNPAALQWAMGSEVALSILQHSTDVGAGTPSEFDGWLLGYRGVSDRFALGLEHLALDQSNGTVTDAFTSIHLSMMALDGLSIGVGLDRAKFDSAGTTQTIDANTIGFSVNLAKQFYLGYAIGSDQYEDNGGTTGDRSTTLYGIAFRTEGSWRWHLAYDAMDKDNISNGVGNGFDSATFTVQVGIGNWVVGAQAVDFAFKGGGSEVSSTIVDLGWVPEKDGLSITGRFWDGSLTQTVPSPVTTSDTGFAVNIASRF